MLFPSLFSEPFDPSLVRAKMSVDSAAQIDLSSLSLTSEEASTLYNLFRELLLSHPSDSPTSKKSSTRAREQGAAGISSNRLNEAVGRTIASPKRTHENKRGTWKLTVATTHGSRKS
jgi:hypothetical protein